METKLTAADAKELYDVLCKAAFAGAVAERVVELKQKLLQIVREGNGKPDHNE